VNKFIEQLRKLRKSLEKEMKLSYDELTNTETKHSPDELQKGMKKSEILVLLKESLTKFYGDYHNISEDFLNFLVRMNIEGSRREKAAKVVVSASLEQKVESILQEFETIMDQQNVDTELSRNVDFKLVIDIKDRASDKGSTRSVSGRSRSSRSRSTYSRSTTSILLEQRVKTEAANQDYSSYRKLQN
jgi:hypothetical protein